jgi:spermidine synthase
LEVGQERSIEKEELLALEFAYITAASRAWTDKLVPVFDMINHGDGKYFNVDSTKVHDTSSEYVEVFARRDIRRGEQLYLSYTECADEYDFRFEYVISDLLRDYGFVAAYPQRWSMYSGLPNTRAKKDSEKVMLVFDIDEIEEKNAHGEITKTYNVTFHSKLDKEDDHHSVNELTDRVFRLRKLWRFVLAHAKVMESEIEREISVEYYQSYKIAATAALEAISGQKVPPENLEHMACEDFELIWKEGEGWDFIEEVKSHFQAVDIYYNEEADDACLLLNNYLHACASNRPHYHEVFVHYPARYLDKVERVLFIGGGDSMVLHEVLKYDSLKKVVGLELDQQVIRTTFSRMGTQPHFDNDKVEWYFGDAAAALRALPREYYGTFDLVVVDILTEVAQALQVTEAYSIMDSALLLLQPNGIIIKNEDEGYVPGTSQNFTNHMLDVMYHDVPLYCLQAFVMGSHNVDFKSKKPIDHNVPTLYLKGVDDFVGQFDTTYTTLGTHKDNDKELKETQTKSTVENTKKLPPLGLIAILEAEETNIALSDASGVESLLKEVFIKHGLQQRYTCQVTNPYQTFKERFHIGFSLTCVLNEGSIVARCFDDARYCAFDVQLWNDIHKLEAIKDDLLKGIGAQKYSVYRVLGTGLKPKGADEDKVIGPPPPGTVEDHGATGLTPSTSNRKQDDSTIHWNNATLHSYDNEAALTQWMSQVNIGVQSIVKCSYLNSPVRTNADIIKVIREKLMKMLKILSEQMMAPADLKLYVYHLGPSKDDDDIKSTNANEDGAVVLSTQWSNGNVVAFWDGKSRLDINAFSLDTNQRTCFEMFRMLLSDFKMNNWKVAVVESFPRGIGNVMNFEFDYASREKGERPYWAPKEMPEQTMT